MVPGNKRQHLRGRPTIPDVDIYGFRPLDTPFGHLCAFEFLRYWTAEPLQPPSRSDPHPRTEWTAEGRKLLSTDEFKNGNAKLCPGKHYRVREQKTPGADGYWTFPSEPAKVYKVLRHSWVIVRRPRPYVPVLIGAKVPDAATQPEETAKYVSAFFRPWTCCPQTSSEEKQVVGSATHRTDIPSLSMLGWQHLQNGAPDTLADGLSTSTETKAPKGGKPSSSAGPQNGIVTNVPDFASSWSAYLQTGVHSEETAQLLQNLFTKVLRHSWVIVRKPRPYVPVLIGAKVPDAATQPEETAKYVSAFFRPWTCCPQTSSEEKQVVGSATHRTDIPSLSMLGWQHLQNGAPDTLADGLSTSTETKAPKGGKPSSSAGPQNGIVTNVPDFASSWSAYLQTGVHSEETAQLLQNLFTKTLPNGEHDEEGDDKEAGSDAGEEIPALQWQPGDMRALLQQSQPQQTDEGKPKKRISKKKSCHVQALTIVETMWGEAANHLTISDKKDSGPRYIREAAEHIAARGNRKKERKEVRPYTENRVPSAALHTAQAGGNLEAWIRSLQEREEKPTNQQLEVLRTIVDRIKEEAKAEQSEKKKGSSASEPLFDMAHG